MSTARALAVHALARETFAAFGDVIETEGASAFPINGGNAQRFHDLARLDTSANAGHPMLSIFRSRPVSLPLVIAQMERHPLGSQAFMPLGDLPFLIVVAEDAGGTPGELRVFLSNGRQGVNYRRGVWHHPLLALHRVSDFLVVDRGGAGENCEIASLPTEHLIESLPG